MNEHVMWSPGVTLEMIEKQVILIAFRFYRGNKTQTAQSLGIAIRTLEAKLEKYEDDGEKQRLANEQDAINRAAILDRQRGIFVDPKTGERRIHGNYSGTHESQDIGANAKPATQARPVHDVPVSKPKEVQVLLQKDPVAAHSGRRR